MTIQRQKLALVIGSLPSVEEIEQFKLLNDRFELNVISSESICGYLSQTSYFKDLVCVVLKDHDENPSFLPGLEQILVNYDLVIVKGRLGLYSYQALKAKWRHRFRLLVWLDNLMPFPSQDIDQMRTIRSEVTNAADGFLVQTQAARHVLETEGVESSRIYMVSAWVEARIERSKASRSEACQALSLSESHLIVSYFGQIEWEESLSILAPAAKILIDNQPSLRDRLRFVFCGIGSFAPLLKDSFAQLGLEDITAYYAPSREAFDSILKASDAIYLASSPSRDRIEGDPCRVLAAMAHGVPLIASRTALIEELCGKHRLDVCPWSAESLAKSIHKLRSKPKIVNNVIQKNLSTCESRFSREKAELSWNNAFAEFMQQKTKVDETSLDHRVLEVESQIRSRQYVAAIDLIETIFKSETIPVHHRANLYRLVGDCFAKLGDLDSAKESYSTAAELDPYSAKIYIGLGTVGLMKESYDVAVLHFQRAVSLAPEDEMANLGLGLGFQGMNELKEASRWIYKSLELNPINSAALFSLVKISQELEDFAQAERALKRYLSINPNDYNYIYTLAGIYFRQQRYNETIELTSRIIDADPHDERAASLAKQAQSCLSKERAPSSHG